MSPRGFQILSWNCYTLHPWNWMLSFCAICVHFVRCFLTVRFQARYRMIFYTFWKCQTSCIMSYFRCWKHSCNLFYRYNLHLGIKIDSIIYYIVHNFHKTPWIHDTVNLRILASFPIIQYSALTAPYFMEFPVFPMVSFLVLETGAATGNGWVTEPQLYASTDFVRAWIYQKGQPSSLTSSTTQALNLINPTGVMRMTHSTKLLCQVLTVAAEK